LAHRSPGGTALTSIVELILPARRVPSATGALRSGSGRIEPHAVSPADRTRNDGVPALVTTEGAASG
jgi:hypothetical protein